MPFTLPPLPYPYQALEPYLDEATLNLHHTKHHQTYVDKLNAALEANSQFANSSLEELVRVDLKTNPTIHNMAGGVLNHNFFWTSLSPQFDQPIPDSFKSLVEPFTQSATTLFGSGWTWIVKGAAGLEIINTPNQDNPLASGQTPLLGLDLWEHAYYLKYQNRRPEYIQSWWRVVNWTEVQKRYQLATK